MQAQATHPLRQKGLPSGMLLISRTTKIDRAGSAALHLEQIETRLMLTLRHQQTQAGGRRFETMPLGAKQHTECTARLGCELQATQPAIIGTLQPEKHCGADTRTQSLFGSPQCFRGAGGTHYEQAP